MRGAYYFDLFAFTNNLIYRDKSSIFGGINNPPICSVLRFRKLELVDQIGTWNNDTQVPIKLTQMNVLRGPIVLLANPLLLNSLKKSFLK